MTICEEIRERLYALRDEPYRDFQSKLIPTVDQTTIIGVRLPALRALAKEIAAREDITDFLNALPHTYYDEYMLHAVLISRAKPFASCLNEVERLLPYIDNWAVCDTLNPSVFGKHRELLLPSVERWLASDRTYTVRFGVKMLMTHTLGDGFDDRFPALVARICSGEYYINMMRAWYFATALAKQYESILPYFTDQRLDRWTHNKSIQKAIESLRISDERKQVLRALKY